MNCFFCGTIRNCSKYIDEVYNNVMKMSELFEDYKILLFYDVSTDDTLSKLQYYANINPKFTFYENKNKMHRLRTYRLATGRNYLINELNKENGKYPFFIMLDWDNVSCGKLDITLMKKSLLDSENWDALSFWNSDNFYYDCWALSVYPYVISCFEFKNGCSTYVNYLNELRKSSNGRYIRCYSAFGGLSIYKTSKFSNCLYKSDKNFSYIPKNLRMNQINKNRHLLNKNTRPSSKSEDCEHRYFHFSAYLTNNARICISPYSLFK